MDARDPTDPVEPTPQSVACPGCDEAIEVDRTLGRSFTCPYCNSLFRLDGGDDDEANEDDGEAERRERERRDAEELDGLRIRQFTAARRAAYRQRSYLIVALGGCVVAVGQLAWMTYRHVTTLGWTARPVGYVLFAIAAAVTALTLSRKARDITRDLSATPTGSGPEIAPDFTPLSDGSNRWQNLHDVR